MSRCRTDQSCERSIAWARTRASRILSRISWSIRHDIGPCGPQEDWGDDRQPCVGVLDDLEAVGERLGARHFSKGREPDIGVGNERHRFRKRQFAMFDDIRQSRNTRDASDHVEAPRGQLTSRQFEEVSVQVGSPHEDGVRLGRILLPWAVARLVERLQIEAVMLDTDVGMVCEPRSHRLGRNADEGELCKSLFLRSQDDRMGAQEPKIVRHAVDEASSRIPEAKAVDEHEARCALEDHEVRSGNRRLEAWHRQAAVAAEERREQHPTDRRQTIEWMEWREPDVRVEPRFDLRQPVSSSREPVLEPMVGLEARQLAEANSDEGDVPTRRAEGIGDPMETGPPRRRDEMRRDENDVAGLRQTWPSRQRGGVLHGW